MSCYSNCYLPVPPRAWSRVQNSCSFLDDVQNNGLIKMPYTGKLVPASSLDLEYAMLKKGNVLQYKKNSSCLTKQQRYSQIAKGQWTNRNTTWATQSDRGYTNPNTQSLQRVGSINITLSGTPTFIPVTCPSINKIINYVVPITETGGDPGPEVLPPPPPPPSFDSGTEIPLTPIPIVEPIVIQDLGNLVCGTKENICTGELITNLKLDNCHPTTDSDVPGQIMELCWNDGIQPWYPRQRYVMTNSANKWPVNYKLLVAAVPTNKNNEPTLESVVTTDTSATLTWDAKFSYCVDYYIITYYS